MFDNPLRHKDLIEEIYQSNKLGIAILWRGMPKYEIDYQVAEALEANRRKREWGMILAGEE